jgi:hypothetical protein
MMSTAFTTPVRGTNPGKTGQASTARAKAVDLVSEQRVYHHEGATQIMWQMMKALTNFVLLLQMHLLFPTRKTWFTHTCLLLKKLA